MSEQCNNTAAWLNTGWVLQLLDEAEQRAKDTYDTKLEAAIVNRTGSLVRAKGWRGWLLNETRLTTREEAEYQVKKDNDGFFYPVEYTLRAKRDRVLVGIASLRQTAQVVTKAQELRMYVSKDDMVYLS